jgi:hypothetical protein
MDPCERAGVGPRWFCDDGCQAQCGCSSCGDPGEQFCREDGIYECQSCYRFIESCSSPDACLPSAERGKAFCADSPADCSAIEQAYEAALARLPLTVLGPGPSTLAAGAYYSPCTDSNCVVRPGHCSLGLGPCWYLGQSQPVLDLYAQRYVQLGCIPKKTCECSTPNVEATCELSPRESVTQCVVR